MAGSRRPSRCTAAVRKSLYTVITLSGATADLGASGRTAMHLLHLLSPPSSYRDRYPAVPPTPHISSFQNPAPPVHRLPPESSSSLSLRPPSPAPEMPTMIDVHTHVYPPSYISRMSLSPQFPLTCSNAHYPAQSSAPVPASPTSVHSRKPQNPTGSSFSPTRMIPPHLLPPAAVQLDRSTTPSTKKSPSWTSTALRYR
jgi:hypothetical protein